ncbi:protein fam221a isoform x1 [Cystoisospora suis]|uniref:Protein FAM221A n=1 Tax=Cystoisospora suis TaxID=483139 RepID=A0A2C6L504_9APIC|nr:protein fam221a isoform x1 [Cystoisospora suis]
MSSIRLSESDLRHVDAYFEYRNLVGDTDGGQLLSQQEYEALRTRAAAASRNPLRVSWRNVANGLDCRLVGPSSSCLCGHRLRDHDWMASETKAVKCRMRGCPCPLFEFIPVQGSQDIKCRCKHSYLEHNVVTRQCRRCSASSTSSKPGVPAFTKKRDTGGSSSVGPSSRQPQPGRVAEGNKVNSTKTCTGFTPCYTCSCGSAFGAHQTVFEKAEERLARGEPDPACGAQGSSLVPTGGLSDFVSLLDGVDRMHLYCEDPAARLREGSTSAACPVPGTDATIISREQSAHSRSAHARNPVPELSDNILPLFFTPCSLLQRLSTK